MKPSTLSIETLLEIIAAQAERIACLEAHIRELEQRLNKNSSNSSKPPSSDGFKKPQTTTLRKKGHQKSGGQPGHKGTTLKQTAHPSHVIHHGLLSCPGCGENLATVAVKQEIVRQVFDMPKPQLEVTEHRSAVKSCPHCKKAENIGWLSLYTRCQRVCTSTWIYINNAQATTEYFLSHSERYIF